MSVSAAHGKNEEPDIRTVDKMTVFQNAVSSFNQSGVSSKQARRLLTQLVRLIYVGETFTEDDGTQLFFTITKLFHKETPGLRQMIYLAIKELRAFTDNVIMGTSVVMKDVQSAHGQIFRPNAIRALARIIDSSSVESIDRLIRAAIVDKDGSVSSAALVSAYNLLAVAKDTVRRWSAETSEALTSIKSYALLQQGSGGSGSALHTVQGISSITQYHALGLLYHMRAHDRVSLVKMIQQLGSSQASLRSPHAVVLLIRQIGEIIDDDPRLRPTLFSYLEGWLRHRSDMVNLEAAKTILRTKSTTPAEAQAVIQILQSFLGSPRAPARFAAIRLLSEYAADHAQIVAVANSEIEGLISDPNRSVATYAITTLLKTGSETSVDNLIDQISDFMDDQIGDDFRIVVVDAIRNLALKFSDKHTAILSFFADQLQSGEGLELKTIIVDALFDMVRAIPESRDAALSHLCEFIEDSEHTELTVRILHLLGAVGPEASSPSQYVRYIYNRVVLENSLVRAAAVSALTKFALVPDEKLQKSIQVLLRRCLVDTTDEVRDRAALSISVLSLGEPLAASFLAPKKKLLLTDLENSLVMYVNDPSQFSTAFSAESIPRITDEQRYEEKRSHSKIAEVQKLTNKVAEANSKGSPDASEPESLSKPHDLKEYRELLQGIPELAKLGPLLHSSASPAQLTEAEMEYLVKAVVHVFENNIVVQFNIDNTFELQVEDVKVELDYELVDGGLEEEFQLPIPVLEPNSSGKAFVVLNRSTDIPVGVLPGRLRYIVKEDPDDEGQEDEYGIEDLEIVPGDFIVPTFTDSFDSQWGQLSGDDITVTRQFPQYRSLADAVAGLTGKLGMMALDGTDTVKEEASHSLKLFGRTLSGATVAAQVRLVRSAKNGVVGKLNVRSSETVAETIANGV